MCTKISYDAVSILIPFAGDDGGGICGIWRNLKWELFKRKDVDLLQLTSQSFRVTIKHGGPFFELIKSLDFSPLLSRPTQPHRKSKPESNSSKFNNMWHIFNLT